MRTSRKLLFGKTLLIALVGTVSLTIILVYLTGLTTHRSLLENSLISLTALSLFLFLFLVFGLYHGLNVYDNYSHKLKLSWRKAKKRMPDSFMGDIASNTSIPDVGGDGIGGIVLALVAWLVFSILLVVLLVVLEAILWVTLVLLVIALYWIIIRALKLIFSKSPECENDLPKSVLYAFGYTVLYTSWLYAVIYTTSLF